MTCTNHDDITSPNFESLFVATIIIGTMLVLEDKLCGLRCFLHTIAANDTTPSVMVMVLLFATGCVIPHLVKLKTDTYLNLDSVWNINVNRWLGD